MAPGVFVLAGGVAEYVDLSGLLRDLTAFS
jgi:hypothetical protein